MTVSTEPLAERAAAIGRAGAAEAAAAADLDALTEIERKYLGKRSELLEVREAIKTAPADERKADRHRVQGRAGRDPTRDRRASGHTRSRGRGCRRRSGARPHPRRPRLPARSSPSRDAGLAGARRHLRRAGLPRVRRTRGRRRLAQLRGAELPRRASGARDAGHAVREARRARAGDAAHAHVAGADPVDGDAAAPDLRGHARSAPSVATRPTRVTRRSSTRSKRSSSTTASRWAT